MQREHAQEAYQTYNIPMTECFNYNGENEPDTGNRELESHLLLCKKARGVFFSYVYHGVLRVYITLDDDSDVYNNEISSLLRSSIDKSNCKTGLLWVRKKTPKLITFLEDLFRIAPSDELFFYEAKKFAVRREQFKKEYDDSILEARPYNDSYLDECLRLLDESMLFCMPPTFHMDEREHHLEQFRFYRDYLMFETFWKDGELVGFYWNNKNEVDLMAVSPKFQRMGYGSVILTRAISKIFHMTDSDTAWLIASSFNERACSFYAKNGMDVHGEYRLARIEDSIEADLQMRAEMSKIAPSTKRFKFNALEA